MEPGGRGQRLPPGGAKVFIERLGARNAVKLLKDLCKEFLEKLEKQIADAQADGAITVECSVDAQKGA